MKLFVSNFTLGLFMALLSVAPDSGRARCTCRPSPPGGETVCESGQIAVCGSSDGVCKGSCISVSDRLQPLQYSAQVLSAVVGEGVTVEDLEKKRKDYKGIIDKLLNSSEKDKEVTFEYHRKKFKVSIGLSEIAKRKLTAAGLLLVPKAHGHLPIVLP